jgi:hypothetical protein
MWGSHKMGHKLKTLLKIFNFGWFCVPGTVYQDYDHCGTNNECHLCCVKAKTHSKIAKIKLIKICMLNSNFEFIELGLHCSVLLQ